MRPFHTIFNHKVSLLSLLLIFTVTGFYACTNSEDFANPLDPENLRTSGAPDGLTLYAGDKQVRVTWNDTGQEGIKTYRIYRRSIGGTDTPFELVGSVDAPANEFIDTQNLENDRRDASGRVLMNIVLHTLTSTVLKPLILRIRRLKVQSRSASGRQHSQHRASHRLYLP